MRINTDGKKSYRDDLYERTARVFDENTKTGGIDAACIHARQDVDGKQEAIEFLQEELPPQQLEEVAELLSTDQLTIEIETEASVVVSES